VRAKPFYFEIKDMVTQFIAAFDDVVIARYNKDRQKQDQINVRYIYAPKERVMYDIINQNKTITLPAIAVNITSVSRDQTRVFNKLDGFYYQGTSGEEKTSSHLKSPIPVNISLKVSILSRYQTDMDQIISNFVPFCNPYVVVSWKVPTAFALTTEQEIRSEILWDGNIAMNYPTELTSSQKARITADTSFTIKGWLFKDTADPAGNIYYIDTNFNTESKLEYYDNFESLSGNSYTFPTSSGLINDTSTIYISGTPTISDVFYNGVHLFNDITLSTGVTGNVLLNGNRFNDVTSVLVSTNNSSYYTNLTSIDGFTRQPPISGQVVNYNVINDNAMTVDMPSIDSGSIRFIPFNLAGYSFSDSTLHSQSLSTNSTFINVE
jgi:hypothetical protein